jgi:hypothetical protein
MRNRLLALTAVLGIAGAYNSTSRTGCWYA